MAVNGTRFRGWLLNTADNRLDLVGDLDGDGRDEMLVTSPWGAGVLKQEGGTMNAVMMAQNGMRFGDWLLNTADNRFGPVGDFDGDGRPEIMISSPWGHRHTEAVGRHLQRSHDGPERHAVRWLATQHQR